MADLVVSPEPTVVQVSADWCVPGEQMRSHVVEVCRDLRVKYIYADVARYRQVSMMYGVSFVPTFLFFRGGAVVGRITGAMSPAKFRDHLTAIL